jgi:anti-anti-sigma factor
MDEQERRFERDGNRLRICTDLDMGMAEELRKRCDHLVSETEGEIVLDLSAVTTVHSVFLGMFTHLWTEATSLDREVIFIVSPQVAETFQLAGLDQILNCRPAEPED